MPSWPLTTCVRTVHCALLTELTIARLTLVDEDMDLINQLLSRNRTLTRFNLIECKWDKAQRQNGTDGEHHTGNSVGATSRIHSFIVALSKNKTLQELTQPVIVQHE
ncbi:hypothetical protein MTO96_038799 [Rhipicephalus appendiculatus]